LLAQEICAKLTVHAAIEEELFYPAARKMLTGNEDLVDEADVEYSSANKQIVKSAPGDPPYDAKVTVLGEYIERTSRKRKTGCSPRSGRAALAFRRSAKRWLRARTICWPRLWAPHKGAGWLQRRPPAAAAVTSP